MSAINFHSIVSGKNQLPYVQIMLDDKMAQFTPEEARSFALQLMIAAENAVGDAFLVHFLGGLDPTNPEQSSQMVTMLRAFRDYRYDLRAKGDPLQWGELGEWPGDQKP